MESTNWMITCWVTAFPAGSETETQTSASFEIALGEPTEMLDWQTIGQAVAQYAQSLAPATVMSAVPMGVFPVKPSTKDPAFAVKQSPVPEPVEGDDTAMIEGTGGDAES